MKAIRLVQVGQPLQMQEIPIPSIGVRDVLVRVKAAGICHSDVHYRAGVSPVKTPPVTLGHEVAGVVEKAGSQVTNVKAGDRVCLHYLVTCGECSFCCAGNEHFCRAGQMLGKHRDGGYAEYVAVPARSVLLLPDEIPFEHGAVLMCSSATSLHALRRSRLKAGESVAIFGAGGLGLSAVQLARALGALDVYAVDIQSDKLELAARLGAIPVNAAEADPVTEIRRLTHRRGVDVAIEMIGLPKTMLQAVQSLAVFGRMVLVGISARPLEIDTYREILGREAEIIGSDDHLWHELPLLIEYARRGVLDLSQIVTRTVPLEADAINAVMDRLESFGGDARSVIVP